MYENEGFERQPGRRYLDIFHIFVRANIIVNRLGFMATVYFDCFYERHWRRRKVI
jgi:hypothetical protein